TSMIALVIGAIGMMNTMMTSVLERTREIGILRAIGWRKRRVVRMVLLESVMLCVVGAVLGTACAIVLIWGASEAPGVNGFVRGDISPAVVGLGFALALGVGL